MPQERIKKLFSSLKSESKKRMVTGEKPLVPGAQRRPRFDPPLTTTGLDHQEIDETVGANDTDTLLIKNQEAEKQVQRTKNPKNQRVFVFSNPISFGFFATIGVGLALIGYYVLVNIGGLGGWITGALFIALGLDPAVRKLESKGMPRIAAVMSVVATIALVLAGLIFWVVPQIATQAVNFVNGVPQAFKEFLESDFVAGLDKQFGIRQWIDGELQGIFTQITQDTNAFSGFLNSLVNAGGAIANIITGTIIVLILSLYFLSSMPFMKAWFVRLTPASKRDKVGVLTEKITASVGQYVFGQGMVAIINGTVAFVVMLIVGAPFPQLLTLFVVMLAFIPLVGGVTAGILVSLICLMDSWQTAVGFAIGYFIYLQIEAYFVSPRIMSRAVSVPGGIAIIAVIAGGALWGVLGAIIAIPVAASILILVQEVLVPRQDRN